jgi:hypothetical protein
MNMLVKRDNVGLDEPRTCLIGKQELAAVEQQRIIFVEAC